MVVALAALAPIVLNDDFGGRALFPSDNWWNEDISTAPVDLNSSAFITFIGAAKGLHPDFGGLPYGIPYVSVGGTQPRVPVTFLAYGDESDTGFDGVPGYPIPDEAKTEPGFIEGAVPGGGTTGDRHVLIVDRDRWVLFELFATYWNASASRWEADSGAIFDLSANDRRPDGWTSADAAGLAILPGLVRYEETMSGRDIQHAFRVTVRATNGYVWPASHRAGSTTGALPMGARLRLRASKNLSGFPPSLQRIFRAMQRYGLIVADNGTDMYITGAMDDRWNNDELNPAFAALTASDFEVIQLGWRNDIVKVTPVITWANPAAITYGTALSATQLNATANVPGAFVYTPASGTVLNPGVGQTLSVTFTPTDTLHFNTVTATVGIDVTLFTDEPLSPGLTLVKASHFSELRDRVDTLRTRVSLGPYGWTDATIIAGMTVVRAVHLIELRAALAEVYVATGRTVPSYTHPVVAGGATMITATDIAELRAAILAVW